MLDREIRVPRDTWVVGADALAGFVKRELHRIYKDTDVSWGRILAPMMDRVQSFIGIRRSSPDAYEGVGATDLFISLSFDGVAGKIRIGTITWVQPRPRI